MFPFKTLILYKIKKDFQCDRSGNIFKMGQQLTYLSSTTNHYEGIEICSFRDFSTGKTLIWHADEMALEKWEENFEVIPFPK